MAILEVAKIQVRRGQEGQTGIPQLAAGEFGWAEDTEHLYIGKRISEGAFDDNNTRILTENDRADIVDELGGVFSRFHAGSKEATTSTYQYREGVSYINASVSTVATKLDSTVSLTDYGIVPNVNTRRNITNDDSLINTDVLYFSSTYGIAPNVGYIVSGPNIPNSTTIVSVTKDVSITLSNPIDDYISTGTLITFNLPDVTVSEDITERLQTAINDLFNNGPWDSFHRKDARRKLILPAGQYLINDTVNLPPYTSIEGEGQELTTLILNSTITNMFKTVDAEGHSFESNQMNDGVKRARQVSIKGMTLQYAETTDDPSMPSLISIDNVLNTVIEDVSFKTGVNSLLVNSGIGVSIRGTGGGIETGDVNLCENIEIHRCNFDSLYIGVEGKGTIVRPVISDSVFSNLNRGVSLYAPDRVLGPTNGLIKSNRFKSIVREAIHVGQSINKSMHISENNYFVQVGNGSDLDDHATVDSTATSVITFYSEGNKTVNDYFHRRTVANSTTNAAFYYWPLVTGKAIVDDTSVFTATIGTYTSVTQGITPIAKLGLTGRDQLVSIRYQLNNQYLSRKGNIMVNVAYDGYTSLTDTYNFNSYDAVIREGITTSTGVVHSPKQFVVSLAAFPEFVDVINTSTPYPGTPLELDGSWFIVDELDNTNAAQITFFNTSTRNIAVFDTQSAPTMTFNSNHSYTLARSIATPLVISVDSSPASTHNYVTLTVRNDSTVTGTISDIEFNINVLQ